MSKIYQIFDGLKTHLAGKLDGIIADDIRVAIPDDRVVTSDDVKTDPPKLTLSLYGFEPAPDLRYSGYFQEESIDLQAQTAELKRLPVPFRAFIQIDTFCRTSVDDWNLVEPLSVMMAARTSFPVNHGTLQAPNITNYEMHPEPGDNQDDLLDGDFHKVIRFHSPVWFDDPRDIEEVALVLGVQLQYQGQTITLQEEE